MEATILEFKRPNDTRVKFAPKPRPRGCVDLFRVVRADGADYVGIDAAVDHKLAAAIVALVEEAGIRVKRESA